MNSLELRTALSFGAAAVAGGIAVFAMLFGNDVQFLLGVATVLAILWYTSTVSDQLELASAEAANRGDDVTEIDGIRDLWAAAADESGTRPTGGQNAVIVVATVLLAIAAVAGAAVVILVLFIDPLARAL